jgi:hypothetical protein
VDLVAAPEHPVDLINTHAAGVDPDEGPLPALGIEAEGLLGVQNHGAEGFGQLQVARVEAVEDHFLVLRGQDPPHLAAVADALGAEVAFS